MSDTITTIPHSREAEEAVIGSVFINPDVYYDVSLFLKASDFHIERNKWIWQAFTNLNKRRAVIDLLTVSDELNKNGKLDELGGPPYLTALVNQVPSSLNAESYGRIVEGYSRRRKYILVANEIAKAAYDEKQDVEKIPSLMRDQFETIETHDNLFVPISQPLSEIYDEIESAEADPREVWGYPTGFNKFDRETGGIERGHLVWLAGEPGIGKTWSLTQIALSMAGVDPGALISMEMKNKAIVRRALSGLSGIRIKSMRSGLGLPSNWREIFGDSAAELEHLPIFLSDRTITTDYLRGALKALKREQNIGWFCVDYALLFADRAENEIVRTEIISRNLKHICNDLELAGVVLQSVTKPAMDGAGNSSAKSGMRGSGQMLHDADTILFLTKFEELDDEDGVIREPDRESMVTLWTKKGREFEFMPNLHLVRRSNSPFFDEFDMKKYMASRKNMPQA